MRQLQRVVGQILVASAQGEGFDQREKTFRAEEFARHVAGVLSYWQAAGTVPPRSTVLGAGSSWIAEQLFATDLDGAYRLLLTALRTALDQVGHPAANDMEVV
jgi:hypothetical protein